MPNLTVDGDLWYLTLIEHFKVHKTIEVNPSLFFDLDEDGNLLGIEGLGPIEFEPALIAFARIVDQESWLNSLSEYERLDLVDQDDE